MVKKEIVKEMVMSFDRGLDWAEAYLIKIMMTPPSTHPATQRSTSKRGQGTLVKWMG